MAQDASPIGAQMTVHADQPGATIHKEIYGQFAEHLGRGIYEGLWVGPDSPIPNTRGIRNDVVAALKDLGVPVLRWPGGCFADEYHWRDGIGPRAQRPRRLNSHWGGVIEDNAFGTHEFMDLCEQIGAQPYICANVGTGSPEEMKDWIEYMTSDSDSTLADERRKNGRQQPWKLKFLGIGNESWGCGGDMTPQFYSDTYRKFHTFVKNLSGNRITSIACGSNGMDFNWTEVLMSHVGNRMNGLSLHYYTVPSGKWAHKGSATQFTPEEWHATLAQTLKMEVLVAQHAAIMDKYDPNKRIGMVIDEWGDWFDVEPGSNGGFLFQQNTLRDAIVAGINLDIFNQHCDRVTMTCIAQMINVLQAMILTDKQKMVLTPTYYVFQMYKVHQDATLIPLELSAPPYKLGDSSIPTLHASASRDSAGRVHLSIVNLDPDHAVQLTAKLDGIQAKNVSGQILTASAMNAHNTFDAPDAIKPAAFSDFQIKAPDQLTVNLPSKSVVVLEIQ
jgi:alpha-N-arabinofuranosidase